jgi:flagellar biosynthesis protein FlhG
MTPSRPPLLGVIGARQDGGPNVVTLNLGVALAQLGRKATIADLGTSDLRRRLGLFRKVEGLGEFVHSDRRSLTRFVAPTPVPNLWIIGPGKEAPGATPFAYPWEQKVRLLGALAAIEGDFVLADLGTALTDHAADFFSMTGAGILVVSADPAEVLRSYEFIKSALYKTIQRRLGPESETAALLAQLERGAARRPTIAHVTGLVRHRDPDEARVIEEICDAFTAMLVVNAGRSLRDMELGDKLRVICRRYLSIRVEYLGFIYEDAAVDTTHGTKDPVMIRQPDSRAAVAMHRIAHKCLQSKQLQSAQPDPALLAARDGRRAPLPTPGLAGGMIEGLLASAVRREIGQVERHLAAAESKLGTPPRAEALKARASNSTPQPAKRTAQPAKHAPQPAKRAPQPAAQQAGLSAEQRAERILKTVFDPADLRALEALIDSLDADYFPDEKWKWKVRALSTPDRVVHYLISRGIRRDFFYRDAPVAKRQPARA